MVPKLPVPQRIGVAVPEELKAPKQKIAEIKAPAKSPKTDEEDAGAAGQSVFAGDSIDWGAIDPLSLPAFGESEAKSFPGPRYLLPIYHAAGLQYDIPWSVLASINEIETGFGQNQGPSSAGAMGWMQFIPSTWAAYGVDANSDGVINPADPVDAIFAAAKYLDAAGGAKELSRAVFAYNHANWYVARVLQRAAEFQRMSPDLLAALTADGLEESTEIKRASGSTGLLDEAATRALLDEQADDTDKAEDADKAREPQTIGEVLLLSDADLRRYVLDDERLSIYPCGREDIEAGVTDRRVLELLEYLAFKKMNPTVTSLRCGHGYMTASGNVSQHSYGAAVDIAAINGVSILGNQGAGSVADKAIREILRLNRSAAKPDQIISLMTYKGAENTYSMADHADHIHVGFRPARPLADGTPSDDDTPTVFPIADADPDGGAAADDSGFADADDVIADVDAPSLSPFPPSG